MKLILHGDTVGADMAEAALYALKQEWSGDAMGLRFRGKFYSVRRTKTTVAVWRNGEDGEQPCKNESPRVGHLGECLKCGAEQGVTCPMVPA